MYALVDVSLELSSAPQDDGRKWWHHIIASTMAGGIQTATAGFSPARGAALGAALGVAALPLWYGVFEVLRAPSILHLIREGAASSSVDRGGGGGGGGEGSTATTSPAPIALGPNDGGKASATVDAPAK